VQWKIFFKSVFINYEWIINFISVKNKI
jgi:hypothetical protein